jgi:hypothetical protein
MGDGLYRVINSTRAVISLVGMVCLTALGIYGIMHGMADISGIALGIGAIAGSHSASNAYEGARTSQPVQSAPKPQPLPRPDNPG